MQGDDNLISKAVLEKWIPRAVLRKYSNIKYCSIEKPFIVAEATKTQSNLAVTLRILQLEDPEIDKLRLTLQLILHVVCSSFNVSLILPFEFYHEYETFKTCIVFETEESRQLRIIQSSLSNPVRRKYGRLNVETRYQNSAMFENSPKQIIEDCFTEKNYDKVSKKIEQYLKNFETQKQEQLKDKNKSFETATLQREFNGNFNHSVQFLNSATPKKTDKKNDPASLFLKPQLEAVHKADSFFNVKIEKC
jgi:hypothetical protein